MDLAIPLGDRRDTAIDFVRGLCLPLMMLDHLRNHWLLLFTYRPVGFFCAAAVFVFLSGFAVGKHYTKFLSAADPFLVYKKVGERALQLYLLHLAVSAITISMAAFVPLGREVEQAVDHPWASLLESALLRPSTPMLEFLPMYLCFFLMAPWLLKRFQAGQEKPVLCLSFVLWFATQFQAGIALPPFSAVLESSGWQFLFVTALYLGFQQRTQPLARPQDTKVLNLSLFGCMVALMMLRHAEVFGLQAFSSSIPSWWMDRANLGPLVILNLYLWVAFLWLVPEPLLRLARQGRVFVAMGHYSFALFAWHVLLFYVFMSWFPQLYRYSILEQALIVCFAIVCLVFPVSFGINSFRWDEHIKRHPLI
jgi:hypothetical protein